MSVPDFLYTQVQCGDCGRVYTCTPLDDWYERTGHPGSPRVCTACLVGNLRVVIAVQEESDGK